MIKNILRGLLLTLVLATPAFAANEGFNTFLNALSGATTPAGTEIIPCLQGGVTKGCTITQIRGGAGSGLPNGGVANNVLVKQSSANGDAAWEAPLIEADSTTVAADYLTVPASVLFHVIALDPATPLTTFQSANTSSDGLILNNTAPATSGNQSYSAALHWSGFGWKTTATAASEPVDCWADVEPIQSTTTPIANLVFSCSNNSGSVVPALQIEDIAGSALVNVLGSNFTSPNLGLNASGAIPANGLYRGSGNGVSVAIGGALHGFWDSTFNFVPHAQSTATTDTNGFFYLDSVAGIPTGVPADTTGNFANNVPLRYDSSDNRLYAYNSGWINLNNAANLSGTLQAAQAPALAGAVTSSAGSLVTAMAPATALPQLIPSAVWASRGSGTFTGQMIRITDIGPPNVGTLFMWDNTSSVWKLTAPAQIIFDTTVQTALSLNTSEQIVKQNTIPAGLLSAGRLFAIRVVWARDGVTDATSVTLRIGSAGTTSDTAVYTAATVITGGSNHSNESETWLFPASTTSLEQATSLAGGSFSVSSSSQTASSIVTFSVADYTANALIISADTTQAGSTNHGQVYRMIVELEP